MRIARFSDPLLAAGRARVPVVRTVLTFVAAMGVMSALGGCSGEPLSNRESGALGGAALGAGVGAIVGSQVGSTGGGIAIGAVSGGLAGGLIGNEQDKITGANTKQDEIIRRQQLELERQERELQDLRRQEFHDNRLREYSGESR